MIAEDGGLRMWKTTAKIVLSLELATALLSNGCLRAAARSVGRGAFDAVDERGRHTVSGLMTAAGSALRDSVLDERTQRRLDALVVSALDGASARAEALRDSLLGPKLVRRVRQLKDSVLDDSSRAYLTNLRNDLIGSPTRALVGSLRDEVLGPHSLTQLQAWRADLLGAKSTDYLVTLLDSVSTRVWSNYVKNIRPGVRGEVGFVQAQAAKLLWGVGMVALAVVVLVYWQRLKYERVLRLVTYQIHEIPDQATYDELTRRIQKRAQETGIEPQLRQVLNKQGVLGNQGWHPPSRVPG
jgi:hypothetical protein